MKNEKLSQMISEIFTDGAAVTNKVKYSILQWSTAAVHFILIFIYHYTLILRLFIMVQLHQEVMLCLFLIMH